MQIYVSVSECLWEDYNSVSNYMQIYDSDWNLLTEEYFPGTLQSEGICKFKCFMAKHVGSLPFLLKFHNSSSTLPSV